MTREVEPRPADDPPELEWPESVVSAEAVAAAAEAGPKSVKLLAESHELLRHMAAQNAAFYNQAAIYCMEAETEVERLRALVDGQPAPTPTLEQIVAALLPKSTGVPTEAPELRSIYVRDAADVMLALYGQPATEPRPDTVLLDGYTCGFEPTENGVLLTIEGLGHSSLHVTDGTRVRVVAVHDVPGAPKEDG